MPPPTHKTIVSEWPDDNFVRAICRTSPRRLFLGWRSDRETNTPLSRRKINTLRGPDIAFVNCIGTTNMIFVVRTVSIVDFRSFSTSSRLEPKTYPNVSVTYRGHRSIFPANYSLVLGLRRSFERFVHGRQSGSFASFTFHHARPAAFGLAQYFDSEIAQNDSNCARPSTISTPVVPLPDTASLLRRTNRKRTRSITHCRYPKCSRQIYRSRAEGFLRRRGPPRVVDGLLINYFSHFLRGRRREQINRPKKRTRISIVEHFGSTQPR